MILLEPIETINRRLVDRYGRHEDGAPTWRVVWSHDEMEKRLITHTKEGFELLNPYIAEVPKYRQWNDNRYVLERYMAVPVQLPSGELTIWKSYEPAWTFEDITGEIALPPKWEMIELIMQSVSQNAAKVVGAKYKEPEEDLDTKDAYQAKLERLEEELFGNETSVGDSLALDSAVGYGTRIRKTKVN